MVRIILYLTRPPRPPGTVRYIQCNFVECICLEMRINSRLEVRPRFDSEQPIYMEIDMYSRKLAW